MQIVCKDLKQHEMMVKELEDAEGERNFFLADPGLLLFSLEHACYSLLYALNIFLMRLYLLLE